jgi:hypothetical protein
MTASRKGICQPSRAPQTRPAGKPGRKPSPHIQIVANAPSTDPATAPCSATRALAAIWRERFDISPLTNLSFV